MSISKPKMGIKPGRVEDFIAREVTEQYHALLCDPPYEIGMMGKDWDRSGIAFSPDTWRGLACHLLPGAFGMAFASSRGWHRTALAIEDAGLILHPTIFGWVSFSGFPKARRLEDERFEGHRYGRQSMKPAVEPVIVFQKPYEGKPADCIVTHGSGTLNIDAGRIPVTDTEYAKNCAGDRGHADNRNRQMKFGMGCGTASTAGRWPANLYLQHSPACTDTG